jgi:hypothetical protein
MIHNGASGFQVLWCPAKHLARPFRGHQRHAVPADFQIQGHAAPGCSNVHIQAKLLLPGPRRVNVARRLGLAAVPLPGHHERQLLFGIGPEYEQ